MARLFNASSRVPLHIRIRLVKIEFSDAWEEFRAFLLCGDAFEKHLAKIGVFPQFKDWKFPMRENMQPFCKLSTSGGYTYRTCDWDLYTDATGRDAWIGIFADHTPSLLEHARTSNSPPAEDTLAAYEKAYMAALEEFRKNPDLLEPFDIYRLCEHRAEMMREFGIGDPYDRVKHEENVAALRHLPQVFAALDGCTDGKIVEMLLRGVLAGNKFDLGAKDTAEQHANGGIDFFTTLNELSPRPWFVDDCEEIGKRLARGKVTYRKAIYFVDNAGGDVVLGAIPFARHLANEGCAVVLAANDEPALNDVLVDELWEILDIAAKSDERLASHLQAGRISVVGTGCDCPLIDLAAVSVECNIAAADCDLVILEGMGRAVESNYDAQFTCDAINLAMIKNRRLAPYMGCEMFDLVVRFTEANKAPKVDHLR